MKSKFFLSFFLFLFFPLAVFADEVYLKNFEVINGSLSISFEPMNNIYTIYLEEEEDRVNFTYDLSKEGLQVSVLGEEYVEGRQNVMTISLADENEIGHQTYTFYLEKKSSEEVFMNDGNTFGLDISPEKEIPFLKLKVILICTILILVLFNYLVLRIFVKKKQKK